MAELPTMPLFTDALLGDTTHLDDAEFGSYMALLIAMWRNGSWLPINPDLLCKYARCKPSRWTKRWAVLESFFSEEDGKLRQKKLVSTYKNAIEKREKFRESGKRGGEAKALKNKEAILANATNPLGNRQPGRATNHKPESINPNGKIESGANAPRRIQKPRTPQHPPEVEIVLKAYYDRAQELKIGNGQASQLLKAQGFKIGAAVDANLLALKKSRRDLEAAGAAKVPIRYLAAIINRLGETEAAQSGVNYDPAF